MRGRVCAVLCAATTTATLAGSAVSAQAAAPVEWYRLATGFVHETYNADGFPNGFAQPNPWGRYTAYLMSTNAQGQRTWRIENFLPHGHLPAGLDDVAVRGLAEGAAGRHRAEHGRRADRARPGGPGDGRQAAARHQQRRQRAKPNPVDFVVAITPRPRRPHGQGRGAWRRARSTSPTVDWPANAPANYVPIKEGGGPTSHGTAVGSLDLGDRVIEAIDIPEHTAGLDRPTWTARTSMVATGDAYRLGVRVGALRDVHPVPVARAPPPGRARAVPGHRRLPGALLPDQASTPEAARRSTAGRWTCKYVDDQVAIADGVLDGTLIGEPYREHGPQRGLGGRRLGARRVHAREPLPGRDLRRQRRGRASTTRSRSRAPTGRPPPGRRPPTPAIDNIKTGFYLIRDHANTSMYLIKGSTKALLVGTGSGTPGIAAYAKRLAGDAAARGDRHQRRRRPGRRPPAVRRAPRSTARAGRSRASQAGRPRAT